MRVILEMDVPDALCFEMKAAAQTSQMTNRRMGRSSCRSGMRGAPVAKRERRSMRTTHCRG